MITLVVLGCGGQPEDDLDPEDVFLPVISGLEISTVEGSDLVFSFSLEYESPIDVVANYQLVSGTAVEGTDFPAASGSVTLLAGETSVALSLPTTQDALDENDENLQLELSGIVGTSNETVQIAASILDDDATPTLSILDVVGNEGDTLEFVVSLSAVSGRNITFSYTTFDSSAVNPSDYTSVNGLGNVLAGNPTNSIFVVTTNDGIPEAIETFNLQLSALNNATAGDLSAVGTINDDDAGAQPTIHLGSAADQTEGSNQTFPVTLQFAAPAQVTADYTVIDGTAVGADVAVTSGTLTIAAAGTSGSIDIGLIADATYEGTENYSLSLSNLSGALVSSEMSAVANILDSDPAPSLFVSGVSVTEGGDAVIVVSQSFVSGLTTSFDLATSDNSASAGSDYTGVSNSFNINPGQTQIAVTIATTDDTTDEPDQTFDVALSNLNNATAGQLSSSVTLTDNDLPPALFIVDQDQDEDQTLQLIVSLSAGSEFPVSFTLQTIDGTATAPADYASLNQGVTFALGEVSRLFPVTLVDDILTEGNEIFFATLTGLNNASAGVVSARYGITDNDVTPDIFVDDAVIVEGQTGVAQVSLSQASGNAITVDYQSYNQTATSGADYVAASGTLSFSPGTTVQYIVLTTTDDALQEGNEDFLVSLSSPVAANILDDQAVVQITDNDVVPNIIAIDSSASEGGMITFNITLDATPTADVVINYQTVDGSATGGSDYTAVTSVMTIASGLETGLVQVASTQDVLVEGNETFTLSLTGATGGVLLDPQAVGTIFDDDVPPDLFVLAASVNEGGTAEVIVSLTSPAPSEVTFDFSTSNGTAVSGSDYSSVVSSPQTIPTNGQLVTIAVPTTQDALDEIDEDFTAAVSNITVANPVVINNTVTILDDDTSPLVFVHDASITEGGNLEFLVTLSEASGVSTAFSYQTFDGSATAGSDYTAVTSGLTLGAGLTGATLTVNTTDDVLFEGVETLSLTLSSLQWLQAGQLSATGTIGDNESTPDIFISDLSVTEGGTGVVIISLSNTTVSEVTVAYTTMDNTATSGADYSSVSGTATISSGSLTLPVTVISAQDATYEGDESFYVSLSSPTNANLLDDLSVVTILEDDTPPISYFVVSGVADPNIQGSDNGVVISAYDTLSNLKTDYTGTVTLSSDDSSATLPANYTFLLADAGVKTIASGVVFNTPGTYYLQVVDTVAAATGSQTGIQVLSNDFSTTVNQAGGQTDPALAVPVDFAVVFGTAIDDTTFTTGDVIQDGTATGITWSIINSGDDINFTLRATAITGEGTVIPRIAAGTVQTLDARQNLASTATDNSVAYCSLASIQVTSPNSIIPVGSGVQLIATGVCANSSTVNLTSTTAWTSDNAGVISVSSAGIATAIAGGSTTLRANSVAIEGTINLTASTVTLVSLSVDPTPTDMANSSNKQLTATALFSDSSSLDVTDSATWSSNNGPVATVNNSSNKGLVSSASAGVVTITANYNAQNASSVVTVNNSVLDHLEITPLNRTSTTGSFVSYYLTAVFTDNSTQNVTDLAEWSSNNVSVIDIDNSSQKGRANFIALGDATITGSYGGLTISTPATVNNNPLTSIAISYKNQTLPATFEQQLTAIGTYADASTADITDSVTWSSDNTSAATASNVSGSKGLVTGIATGTAVIDAALSGVNQTLTVTITGATLTQLDVFPSETFLGLGLNQQFYVTALFSDLTTMDVTDQVAWSSSSSGDLNISNGSGSEGFATNLYGGSGVSNVTITATKGGVSGVSNVILSDASLTGITTTPVSAVLNTSSGTDLRSYGQYSDGGSYEITNNAFWSSSNTSLGVVSNSTTSKGELTTLLAQGTVTITSSYSGYNSSAVITISNAGGESTNEAGLGLSAYYYSGSAFDTFAGLRVDSTIDFNWGTGSNAMGLTDNFSTRWIGRIRAPDTDNYTFYTNSDEGVRVYLDSNLIIDNYTPHTSTTDTSGSVALTAGQEYNVIVEYYEQTGDAEMGLQWSNGSISQQPIPQQYLLPPDTSARPPAIENMALWLDGADASTMYTDTGCSTAVSTDGDAVACWADKSGYGRHFTQATANQRPAYRTSALNSLPGLDFLYAGDGNGDVLEDDDGENYINGFSAFEFFIVVQSDVTNTDRGVLDTEDPDGADDNITLRYDAAGWGGGCSNCIKGGINSSSGSVQSESVTNTQSTSGQVIGATWNSGGEFKIYIDGVFSQSWDDGTVGGNTSAATKMIIGKGPKDTGAGNGWDGKVLEVIYFNTALTNAERDQVMDYLKDKWGI